MHTRPPIHTVTRCRMNEYNMYKPTHTHTKTKFKQAIVATQNKYTHTTTHQFSVSLSH